DIIHTWMYHANLLGLLFMRRRALVWSILCSYMDLDAYGPVYKLTVHAGAAMSSFPDLVVANSQAGRGVHQELGYHPKRWEIIPNGFDTDVFRPDPASRAVVRSMLGIPREALVIGLIARFDIMKDHGNFFEAARLLLKTQPGAYFLLAGRGVDKDNPQIREWAAGMGRGDQVILLGERADVPAILPALDISTSSSCGEGLPNNIGESMAAGIPCVVTDVGDSAMLVEDTGIVVPKKDPQALCTAWQRLMRDGEALRRDLGERARKRIIERYAMATMVRSYEALYTDLMKEQTS
ncbi:glycosyltransferase, partial [bacterium]|nr:glycosyltransferase [bacterium]